MTRDGRLRSASTTMSTAAVWHERERTKQLTALPSGVCLNWRNPQDVQLVTRGIHGDAGSGLWRVRTARGYTARWQALCRQEGPTIGPPARRRLHSGDRNAVGRTVRARCRRRNTSASSMPNSIRPTPGLPEREHATASDDRDGCHESATTQTLNLSERRGSLTREL